MFPRFEAVVERYSSNRQSVSFALVAGLSGVLVASRFLNPDQLPGLCLFRMVTGIPCMFCGLTHAFHAISVGQFQEALGYHPLAFVAYGLVVFHFVIACVRALDKRSILPRLPLSMQTMLIGTFGVFTFVWVFDLVHGLLSL